MAAYRFGDFTLDVDIRQVLWKGTPVHLSPKAFRLLQILVEAAPKALSKGELQAQLWPETFVVEANLVSPTAVTLQDTGSKNGSFVGGSRVEAAMRLTDGDQVTIGAVPVSVRIMTDALSTETAILEAAPGL